MVTNTLDQYLYVSQSSLICDMWGLGFGLAAGYLDLPEPINWPSHLYHHLIRHQTSHFIRLLLGNTGFLQNLQNSLDANTEI